jgi:hypothetical protein
MAEAVDKEDIILQLHLMDKLEILVMVVEW